MVKEDHRSSQHTLEWIMISTDTLKIIAERDPDGRDTKPSDADYVAWRVWVKTTFGVTAWRAYLTQGV